VYLCRRPTETISSTRLLTSEVLPGRIKSTLLNEMIFNNIVKNAGVLLLALVAPIYADLNFDALCKSFGTHGDVTAQLTDAFKTAVNVV